MTDVTVKMAWRNDKEFMGLRYRMDAGSCKESAKAGSQALQVQDKNPSELHARRRDGPAPAGGARIGGCFHQKRVRYYILWDIFKFRPQLFKNCDRNALINNNIYLGKTRACCPQLLSKKSMGQVKVSGRFSVTCSRLHPGWSQF